MTAETARKMKAWPELPDFTGHARLVLAAAVLGLAALGLRYGDFALQWQPVPEGLPGRQAAVWISSILFGLMGLGLLVPRLRLYAAWALTALFLAWTLVLKGPGLIAGHAQVVPWLGFCEILAISCGTAMLAARQSGPDPRAILIARTARYLFGACLPVFGLSHFVYIQFTADMIPAWIPFHLFWAWFTGVAHVAAGVAILTGQLHRLASLLFAVMVSGIVLLLHVPRTLAAPADRAEWTMLVIASLIAGAAWCMAAGLNRRKT